MNLPEHIRRKIEAYTPPELRDYISRMIYKESKGNTKAGSSTGAKGLLQFTRGTGKSYGLVSPSGDIRENEDANIQAGVRLTLDNRNQLSKALGREPTFSELALAHQQGAGTAAKMILGTGNAPPRNLAVNRVNPDAPPQEAARQIMSYYGFDGRQQVPQIPGMTLAYNPVLPPVQQAAAPAASPFPPPAASPPAAPNPGFLSRMGIVSPETEAQMKTAYLGADGKGGPGSGAAALDTISKGVNPKASGGASDLNTLTPMSPDSNQASAQMGAQQLMQALLQNRRQKFGLTLTDRMP